ncbi:MAG: hypothetical protein WCK90_03600 [archaeon]
MTNEYQPTRMEIASRVCKRYANFVKHVGMGAAHSLMTPWAVPSMISTIFRNGECTGEAFAGYVLTAAAQAGAAAYYGTHNGNFKPLIIPIIATNVTSLLVEIVAGSCRNAKKELIEEKAKQTNEDLVSKLEATK